MTLGIEYGKCNGDRDTCVAAQQILEYAAFCRAMEPLDPFAGDSRQALGSLATMCAENRCPGQNPTQALQAAHNVIANRPD